MKIYVYFCHVMMVFTLNDFVKQDRKYREYTVLIVILHVRIKILRELFFCLLNFFSSSDTSLSK